MPLVGSALSDSAAYRYLPRSFAYLPPASKVVELLEQAGFGAVQHELLSGGISQLYIATRKHEAGTPMTARLTATTAAARPRRTRALQAAGRLVSTTIEVDAKLLPGPVRAAGYDGRRLWSRADASLLALGEALRLPAA